MLIAETTAPLPAPVHSLDVTEYERITCDQCDKPSPYFDDGDGDHDAQDAGWHVLDRDECGCPVQCRDCADEWCGYRDTSPRLVGMRVV
ncbi:hypothetical protein ABR737_01480 [Streptomyces sp. Edi2]|uniref:hypothetical protein n=1 Tax=Streptomyces sp. Edi2 TaxID=3162528 RepID=UPI00330635B0